MTMTLKLSRAKFSFFFLYTTVLAILMKIHIIMHFLLSYLFIPNSIYVVQIQHYKKNSINCNYYADKITKISKSLPWKMHKLCIFSPLINLMKLQDKGSSSDNSCESSSTIIIDSLKNKKQKTKQLNNKGFNEMFQIYFDPSRLPEPLGRKSFPTMLSSTEDFPELCDQIIYQNQTLHYNFLPKFKTFCNRTQFSNVIRCYEDNLGE